MSKLSVKCDNCGQESSLHLAPDFNCPVPKTSKLHEWAKMEFDGLGKFNWLQNTMDSYNGAKTKWSGRLRDIDLDREFVITARELASCVTVHIFNNGRSWMEDTKMATIDIEKLEQIIKSKL